MAAVIGDPVAHSLSPLLLNQAFQASELDWVFVGLRVGRTDLAAAIAGVRALGITGLSVTTPHKSDVVALLDRLDPSAEAVGAVNCVVREADALVGHNTDAAGVLGAAAQLGFDLSGASALVLGAGGAARAAVVGLGRAGCSVGVWARRPEAAETAAALGGPHARAVAAPDPSGFDLVVNATSVGMEESDPSLLTTETTAGQSVVEMVYRAGPTDLERRARRAGCPTVGGADVLLHQAAAAFFLWTGQVASLDAMRSALPEAQESATMDR